MEIQNKEFFAFKQLWGRDCGQGEISRITQRPPVYILLEGASWAGEKKLQQGEEVIAEVAGFTNSIRVPAGTDGTLKEGDVKRI